MKRIIPGCAILVCLVAIVVASQGTSVKSKKGMLRHTVAFNFKPGVSTDLINKILAETRSTLPTIAGAANIVVGVQTSDWTKYKYGISIDFANRDAKEAYAKSPQSIKLHEQFKKYVEDEVVIDIVNE